MVKQIQTIATEFKSVELIRLFKHNKAFTSKTTRTLASYRIKAEDTIGLSDNLYKINFNIQTSNMTIELVGEEDQTTESLEDKYNDYVSSYIDWRGTTEGVNSAQLKPSFLHRNLNPGPLEKISVKSNFKYNIDPKSYHMYYVIGSEELFARPSKTMGKKRFDWQASFSWSRGLDDETRVIMEKEANILFKKKLE
ncbi:hypothetical protein G6F56_011461 [Rhizopus delemar]|nr:hypothetical protein G6F56_011461 [Rhizopus delemar]